MGDEGGQSIKKYEQYKRAMIRELIQHIEAHQPTDTDTRSIADAINRACRHFGYRSGANASMIAKRPLTEYEKKHLLPTEVRAGNFACAFALYGDKPWADTPEEAQYQVYSYCLFGSPAPPPGANTSRLDALPKVIKLERIRPTAPEPIEEREAIAAQLRAATPEAVADYLEALAENIRGLGLQPVEDEPEAELPCDEDCVMATYLRLAQPPVVDHPITDENRQAVSESTGIPLQRVARLLCGDPWTAAEAIAIEAYVGGSSKFTLEGLAAAARSKADDNSKSLGAVGRS